MRAGLQKKAEYLAEWIRGVCPIELAPHGMVFGRILPTSQQVSQLSQDVGLIWTWTIGSCSHRFAFMEQLGNAKWVVTAWARRIVYPL